MRLPLCRDCKWFLPSALDAGFHKCTSPRLVLPRDANLVTGDLVERTYDYCSLQRYPIIFKDRCGPLGKFFEPRAE
jgi:hypothetical protein